jgi:hypothetical protein
MEHHGARCAGQGASPSPGLEPAPLRDNGPLVMVRGDVFPDSDGKRYIDASPI